MYSKLGTRLLTRSWVERGNSGGPADQAKLGGNYVLYLHDPTGCSSENCRPKAETQ